MEEIDFKRLFGYILSKIYIIFLSLILVVSAGEIYTFNFQTPLYYSTTRLVMTNEVNSSDKITQNDVTLINNLVKTYAEIVTGRGVLAEVVENLNLDMSVEALAGKVTATAGSNTQLITIKVQDQDPARAQQIANEIAKVFKKEVMRVYNIDNIRVEYEATLSHTPFNIDVTKQTVYYAAGGFVLGMAVIFLMMYLDNTIKDRKTVEERVGLTVLGVVPKVEK